MNGLAGIWAHLPKHARFVGYWIAPLPDKAATFEAMGVHQHNNFGVLVFLQEIVSRLGTALVALFESFMLWLMPGRLVPTQLNLDPQELA